MITRFNVRKLACELQRAIEILQRNETKRYQVNKVYSCVKAYIIQLQNKIKNASLKSGNIFQNG